MSQLNLGDREIFNSDYSTSETKTGATWIDGKPIYRKVIYTLLPAGSSAITVSTGLVERTIDFLVNLRFMILNDADSSNVYYFDTTYVSGTTTGTQTVNCFVRDGGSILSINNTGSWPATCKCYCIIEYTKVTD